MKRAILVLFAIVALAFPLAADKGGDGSARLQLVEATTTELQKALQTRLVTSEQLVQMYLNRIAAYDQVGPHLNSFIHLNPHALDEARASDADRHRGNIKSPLFGVPLILKDNIDTAEIRVRCPTVTAGPR